MTQPAGPAPGPVAVPPHGGAGAVRHPTHRDARMKTRRMVLAALAALALVIGETGYFGSGHEAGQGQAPASIPALQAER